MRVPGRGGHYVLAYSYPKYTYAPPVPFQFFDVKAEEAKCLVLAKTERFKTQIKKIAMEHFPLEKAQHLETVPKVWVKEGGASIDFGHLILPVLPLLLTRVGVSYPSDHARVSRTAGCAAHLTFRLSTAGSLPSIKSAPTNSSASNGFTRA